MKILLTDDSRFTRRRTIAALPKDREWIVEEATNGLEALEKFQTHQPEIVLLDLTMPVMDGFEALEKIMALDPQAKVFICTADVQPKARERVLASGALAVIGKPITTEKLQRVFDEHL